MTLLQNPRSRRLGCVGAALAFLGLSGVGFEQIGRRRDRHRYEQIGQSVSINGRTLNLFCSGQGGPTVVFDTFGHQSGYSWSTVQHEVAEYTRACWYDRAGYGWSELGPSPRTFQSVASDLHSLLRKAGVQPPFLLVGAGDAALHIRVYHGNYPGEVAGVVMVNGNDVDDPRMEIPDSAKGGFAKLFGSWTFRARRTACWVRPFLGGVGAIRFASLFGKPRRTDSFGLTAEQQAELDDLSDNATTQQASEACAREESLQQVRVAGDLRNVPLVVLVSDAGGLAAGSQDSVEDTWHRYRVDRLPCALASLSSRGGIARVNGVLTESAIAQAIRDAVSMVAAPAGE